MRGHDLSAGFHRLPKVQIFLGNDSRSKNVQCADDNARNNAKDKANGNEKADNDMRQHCCSEKAEPFTNVTNVYFFPFDFFKKDDNLYWKNSELERYTLDQIL